MEAYEPFLKKQILFPLAFTGTFLNMILPSFRIKLSPKYSWNLEKMDTTYFLPFFLFLLAKETIPQEQEMWNYNSVRDKWYVALLWIINESRRALVLPSRPSVIQTVWHKQDTVTKQVETHIHTAQYMQTCQLHQIQPFWSFSLQSYMYFLIKLTSIFLLLVSASCWTVVFAGVRMLLLL